MVAQGSRQFAFTLDTIDESKNQSKGAKVHGKKVSGTSTPMTSRKVEFLGGLSLHLNHLIA